MPGICGGVLVDRRALLITAAISLLMIIVGVALLLWRPWRSRPAPVRFLPPTLSFPAASARQPTALPPAASTQRATAASGTPAPVPTGTVDAESQRDHVFTVDASGQRQELPAPGQVQLAVGSGVGVDEQGRALLRFPDLLTVEVLRGGQLILQELTNERQAVLVSLLQRFGVLFNDFNPQRAIKSRLRIETEYAIIEALGTRFLVVKEANTPLEWVIALEAGEADLQVTAKSGTIGKPVPGGVARWVAPIGEASPAVPYDRTALETWLEDVRNGQPVPEVSKVLWPQAKLDADVDELTALPATLQGVTLTVESGSYALQDCNDDGFNDIVLQDGVLKMDFRGLLARVDSLDVTVINLSQQAAGLLQVYNPADELIDEREIEPTAGEPAGQLLSLRSDQPYHFARLNMAQGCFVRFGAPRPMPTPVPPQACLTTEAGLFLRAGPGTTYDVLGLLAQGVELTATGRTPDGQWLAVRTVDGQQGWVAAPFVQCAAAAVALPRVTPALPPPTCSKEQPADWGTYQVRPGDTLTAIAARSGTTVARLQEVNCLSSDLVRVGELLFVPLPPTPTPSPPAVAVVPTGVLTSPGPRPTGAITSAQATQQSQLQPASLPDLLVTDLRPVGLARLSPDGQVLLPVRVVVHNNGGSPAKVFKVAVEYRRGRYRYVVPFKVRGQSDPWYPFTAQPLLPDTDVVLVGTLTLAPWLQGEAITLVAVADSCVGEKGMPDYCRVQEENEQNNTSAPYQAALPANRPPRVAIHTPPEGAEYLCRHYDKTRRQSYALVLVRGSASDPEEGPLTEASLIWTTDRTDLQDPRLGSGPGLTVRLYCAQGEGKDRTQPVGAWHELSLTAADSLGKTASTGRRIYVKPPRPTED